MNIEIHNKNNFFQEQVIVAQCSPRGAGAIALIRLSGADAIFLADSLAKFSGIKKLSDQKTHTIHFGYVVDASGKHIDQVLFLLMRGPKTFTGQDIVEITCHNNQFLIEAIIDRAIECGARIAANGEFTQRAVELGRIDLVQAEAVNDLIHAQTAESLQYSLKQIEGTLSSFIAKVESSVIELIAFCEGSFEFLDESDVDFLDDIKIKINKLVVLIQDLLKTYSKQQIIKDGVRISIIGDVNVGKSSLFNCLINKKRSIVTEIAGTTRDIVESGIYKNSGFLTFVDTAGIRNTCDRIEKEGIDRSLNEIMCADVLLLVIDCSIEMSDERLGEYKNLFKKHGPKIIVVKNKIDLNLPQRNLDHVLQISKLFEIPLVCVSATQNLNIEELHSFIEQKIIQLKGSGQVVCLLNQRQYSLLESFLGQLLTIDAMLKNTVDYELISYRLRESLQILSQITGRTISQEALNKIFQTFCVGK